MPILTPCADAVPASKRPLIATAANNPDFICASQQFYLRNLAQQYFITLRLPIYFRSANSIGGSLPSFRGDAKHRTSGVQLHPGESRDSGFALARAPE